MITPAIETARILLLDTTRTERRSLSLALSDDKYEIRETNSLESALDVLSGQEIQLLVVVYAGDLPAAPEVVRAARHRSPATEIMVVMAESSPEDVAATFEAGAFDCLPSMPPTEQLLARARRALEHRELKLRVSSVREQVAMNYTFDNVVGISKTMADLRETLARLAPTDIPLLITGPAGTGKDLCARVVHYHSERRREPVVPIDCATPEPVLMVELFGSRDSSERPGLIEAADGGTLLLKNIEEMPEPVQERLMAFLRTFTLGDSGRKLDIRLLSTSTVSSDQLEQVASLRTDLLARLNVLTVALPALRERAEDIEMLIEYFLRRIAAETGRRMLTISRAAADRLIRHRWPGNVRELENTLRRAAALTSENTLENEDIVFVSDGTAPEATEDTGPDPRRAHRRLDENQRELIQRALVENDWNYTRTARELGIGRTTLWRKVKKFDLSPETVGS